MVVLDDVTGRAQYFGRKVLRTKYFVKNLLERARITKKRILNRPLCGKCGMLMELIQKKKTGGTFWACYNKIHAGGKLSRESWDHCLNDEEKKIVKNWARSRLRSRKKAQALRIAKESAALSTKTNTDTAPLS